MRLLQRIIEIVIATIPILAFDAIFIWKIQTLWAVLPFAIIGSLILIFLVWLSIGERDIFSLSMQSLFWLNFAYCIYRGDFHYLPANTAYLIVVVTALLFVVVLPSVLSAIEWKKKYYQMWENYSNACDKLKEYADEEEKRDQIRNRLKSSLR